MYVASTTADNKGGRAYLSTLAHTYSAEFCNFFFYYYMDGNSDSSLTVYIKSADGGVSPHVIIVDMQNGGSLIIPMFYVSRFKTITHNKCGCLPESFLNIAQFLVHSCDGLK